MVFLTLCISPPCHHAVGAIRYDNFRKTHDVDVFVQNERLVQFKKSDVIVNEVRVITLVHQDLGDSSDLLMGIVLLLMVLARLYGQMVQVAIAKKRQSFTDFEIFCLILSRSLIDKKKPPLIYWMYMYKEFRTTTYRKQKCVIFWYSFLLQEWEESTDNKPALSQTNNKDLLRGTSSIIYIDGGIFWYVSDLSMTTYSSTQCEAVTTHCGWMMLPPQLWRP